MMSRACIRLICVVALAASVLAAGTAAAATQYAETKLVSDLSGAAQLDPNLKNPWGIDFSNTTPIWISNNGTGTSSVFKGSGGPSLLTVTVPGAPTGVAFNGTSGFQVAPGQTAHFIFGSEDGTISAWNSGGSAQVKASTSDAVYKGVAIGSVPLGGVGKIPVLYATNFNSGQVDVFGPDFSRIGSFTDGTLPAGYAPFNVQNIGDKLYVTFAKQDADKHDDVAGPGNGFIDVFNLDGTLVSHFASGGALNSPWGLARAPATGFGEFSGDLLVGNFGDGRINAFHPDGSLAGPLLGTDGKPLTIEGLWGLKFGEGGANNGPMNTLFFTAGIPGPDSIEDHGLFGHIAVVPEPHSYTLVAAGLALIMLLRRRTSHSS